MRLLLAGNDITAIVQEWMGHRDFATTLVYADYTPNEHEAQWVELAFAVDEVPLI